LSVVSAIATSLPAFAPETGVEVGRVKEYLTLHADNCGSSYERKIYFGLALSELNLSTTYVGGLGMELWIGMPKDLLEKFLVSCAAAKRLTCTNSLTLIF